MSTYDQPAYGSAAVTRDQTRAVFGQVMGLVAVTVGFAALGAYIGRNLSGGAGLLFFIAAFACVFGLNIANARGASSSRSRSCSASDSRSGSRSHR